MSQFVFSAASMSNLLRVRPELVSLVSAALALSTQDFAITCGLRSEQDEAKAVACGNSKTMHSMHLEQPDGFAWAIDAVPVRDGQPEWDWDLIYPVAQAFHDAAEQLGIASHIRWGGCWDRTMEQLGQTVTPESMEQAVKEYAIRHKGPDLLDGPHFEWVA